MYFKRDPWSEGTGNMGRIVRLGGIGLSIVLVSAVVTAYLMVRTTTRGTIDSAVVEERYRVWRETVDRAFEERPPSEKDRSDRFPVELVRDNQAFRDLVALGAPALPYLIAKMPENRNIGWVVREITQWNIHMERTGETPREYVWFVPEFPEITSKDARPKGPPTGPRIYRYWWEIGRKKVPEVFEGFYRQWQEKKAAGDEAGAKDRYQRMIDLGIVALPCMVGKVQAGDKEMIPAIAALSDKAVAKDATPDAVQTWWAAKKGELRVLLEPETTSLPSK